MTYDTQTDVDDFDMDGAVEGMAPAERVRELNDMLRTAGIGGKTRLTSGLVAKGADFVERACAAVRAFSDFDGNNDPWQEHDCAALEVDGEQVIFKIDYYDVNMQFLSPDPADPNMTRRVLTIMLAEEY